MSSAFAAARFAAKTRVKAKTRRQIRIERRKNKLNKIEDDLKETEGILRKFMLNAVAKREAVLLGLDG